MSTNSVAPRFPSLGGLSFWPVTCALPEGQARAACIPPHPSLLSPPGLLPVIPGAGSCGRLGSRLVPRPPLSLPSACLPRLHRVRRACRRHLIFGVGVSFFTLDGHPEFQNSSTVRQHPVDCISTCPTRRRQPLRKSRGIPSPRSSRARLCPYGCR